eukprot:756146-Amphidinium_carterae.1
METAPRTLCGHRTCVKVNRSESRRGLGELLCVVSGTYGTLQLELHVDSNRLDVSRTLGGWKWFHISVECCLVKHHSGQVMEKWHKTE